MKAAILALLLGATLFVIGLACADGGDTLTLEEYFAALEEIDERTEPEVDAMMQEFGVGSGVQATPNPTFIAAFSSLRVSYMDEYARLKPPAKIKDAHDRLVEVGREFPELVYEVDPAHLEMEARMYDALCEIYSAADEVGIDHDFQSDAFCDPADPSKARRRTPAP